MRIGRVMMLILFATVCACAADRAGTAGSKASIAAPANPACRPIQRTDWALNYHKGMLDLKNKEKVAVLFLGDSIMNDIWRSRSLSYAERVKEGGNPVWQKYYDPLPAANFGISGDETGNLLWRITEGGALDGFRPKKEKTAP